ncbi:hypothetical protein [Halalkalibacillus halophilus]|uniref:hypothetical protein n=1 Tax=Halalkalibacillus halophilus TaxID=392827 RepID=UPI00040DB332|nr:hypothetical protein [Halalkalibacillus halophilus]
MDEAKENVKTGYEYFMVFLATISVSTIWLESDYNNYIVWGTWGIFFIDLVIRLYTSNNKLDFLKTNPFLVIAAVPLDAIFQVARVARILHLIRLKSITKYYTMPIIRFLKNRHLAVVVAITFLIIFLSLIPLRHLEEGIESYYEAFLGSLMSLVFFGYSMIEPTHWGSYIIIVLLTIFGVMLHGLIISTAFDIVVDSKWFKRSKRKVMKKVKS